MLGCNDEKLFVRIVLKEYTLHLDFLQNELHAAASMTNEASRPDLDFMAPEYALRGNDADILQVISNISSKMDRHHNEAVLIHH